MGLYFPSLNRYKSSSMYMRALILKLKEINYLKCVSKKSKL